MAHPVRSAARLVRIQSVCGEVWQRQDLAESGPLAVRDVTQLNPDTVSLHHRVLTAIGFEDRGGDPLHQRLATSLRERTEDARRALGESDDHTVDRLRMRFAANEYVLLIDEAPRERLHVSHVSEARQRRCLYIECDRAELGRKPLLGRVV